jgi:hypothetical protein
VNCNEKLLAGGLDLVMEERLEHNPILQKLIKFIGKSSLTHGGKRVDKT